jgi:hypothetical protein
MTEAINETIKVANRDLRVGNLDAPRLTESPLGLTPPVDHCSRLTTNVARFSGAVHHDGCSGLARTGLL